MAPAAKLSPSQLNTTAPNMQENAQLSAAQSYRGRSKPRGCSAGGRARSRGAKLRSCPTSLFSRLPRPTRAPSSFPGHRLPPPPQIDAAWAGGGCLPQGSACRSLDFGFIYYYSLLLFIYSFLFLFHFEHAQLCHLGFAENVNKKAAFKCSLSLREYISHPTQLQCSHPEIKT